MMKSNYWDELSRQDIAITVYYSDYGKTGWIKMLYGVMTGDRQENIYYLIDNIITAQHQCLPKELIKTDIEIKRLPTGQLIHIKQCLCVLYGIDNRSEYIDITDDKIISAKTIAWIKSRFPLVNEYWIEEMIYDRFIDSDNRFMRQNDVKSTPKLCVVDKKDRSPKIRIPLKYLEIMAIAIIPNLTPKQKKTYCDDSITRIGGTRDEMDRVKHLIPIEYQKNKWPQSDVDKVQTIIARILNEISANKQIPDVPVVEEVKPVVEEVKPVVEEVKLSVGDTTTDTSQIEKSDEIIVPAVSLTELYDRTDRLNELSQDNKDKIINCICYNKKPLNFIENQLEELENLEAIKKLQSHVKIHTQRRIMANFA